jgi:hypothetical protein
MPKYTIAVADSPNDLIAIVQSFIERGWECQGGVAFDSWKMVYMQAVIKIDYKEE